MRKTDVRVTQIVQIPIDAVLIVAYLHVLKKSSLQQVRTHMKYNAGGEGVYKET